MTGHSMLNPSSDILPRPVSRLRRIGCALGIGVWFALLLTPCMFILLLSQQQIEIRLGDMPGQTARVWLINEARERGLGIAWPTIRTEGAVSCIQTTVSYAMWMGNGEATSFCECYTRQESGWLPVEQEAPLCNP